MLPLRTLPLRAVARKARLEPGARRAAEVARVLTNPRELRALCFRRLRRALDSHMRSAFFLRCMRQNISWMNTLRSLASPLAAGSADAARATGDEDLLAEQAETRDLERERERPRQGGV